MRSNRNSISQAISLKPEVEFEVIKLILLRERYLARLQTKLKECKGEIDIGIVGAFDTLRDATIETVETIEIWEQTQVTYPIVKPFVWNGENYLRKMTNGAGDTAFLSDYPTVIDWLGFNPGENNPFLVPPETYGEVRMIVWLWYLVFRSLLCFMFSQDFKLAPNAFMVFGNRPAPPERLIRTKAKKKGFFLKSPYETPLYNDVQAAAATFVKTSVQKERSAGKKAVRKLAAKKEDVDPYDNYISTETAVKIRRCWKILIRANPDLRYIYSSRLRDFSHSFNASFLEDPPTDIVTRGGVTAAHSYAGHRDKEAQRGELEMGQDSFIAEFESGYFDVPEPNCQNGELTTESAYGTVDQGSELHEASNNLAAKSFQSSFNFHQDFQGSLQKTSLLPPSNNASLRFQDLHQDNSAEKSTLLLSPNEQGSTLSRTQGVKVWAPHEIKLQTVVHKRGGELFVITAAGAEGRMKAPSRKTRFERLQNDIEHVSQQENRLSMTLEEFAEKLKDVMLKNKLLSEEDVDAAVKKARSEEVKKMKREIDDLGKIWKNVYSHKRMLLYQHDRFKLLIGGEISSHEKQRQMKQLDDGQTLEKDEMLSISLEDKMANKLQFMVRNRIAGKMRRALIDLRNRSARKIQNAYRILLSHRQFLDTMAAMRYRKMIDRMSTSLIGRGKFMVLRRDANRDRATALLQRCVRGMLGRSRIRNKRIFVRSVEAAVEAVEGSSLAAKDIDELAGYIDYYVKHAEVYIPVEVMTLLRTILYMLNGESAEIISVIVDKKVRPENISTGSLSWIQAIKILRRKGRLLRRMRSLASHVQCPNAIKLEFSASCVAHLSEAMKSLTTEAFEYMTYGKTCVIKMLIFVTNINRIYSMQDEFPEYFGCSQPGWFKKLLPLRLKHEKNLIEYRVAASSAEILNEQRVRKIAAGKRYGLLSNAYDAAMQALALAESRAKESNKIIMAYLARLSELENRRLKALTDFERSKVLGVDIARRELAEYLAMDVVKDEDTIAKMNYDIDDKNIMLLELRSKIIHCNRAIEQDKETRDYEIMLEYQDIYKAEAEVSQIEARLLVLKEEWDAFISYIGGIQFVDDLRGEEMQQYEAYTTEIKAKIARRREILADMFTNMTNQIQRVKKVKQNDRQIYYMGHLEWDAPVDIEKQAEATENYEAALREAEKAARALTTPNKVIILPNINAAPVLLIIDSFIPQRQLDSLLRNISRINFLHSSLQDDLETVFTFVQDGLGAGKNVALTVNRGIHRAARVSFFSTLRALKTAFVPTPRVVCVDGYKILQRQDWHLGVSTNYSSLEMYNVEESYAAIVKFGKAQHVVELLRSALPGYPTAFTSSGGDCRAQALAVQFEGDLSEETPIETEGPRHHALRRIPQWFHKILRDDMTAFLSDIKAEVKNNDDIAMYDLSDAKSAQTYAFLVLAASVASLCGLWRQQELRDVWSTADIINGARSLAAKCSTAQQLVDLLGHGTLSVCTMPGQKFLRGSSSFYGAWNHLNESYGFYDRPVVLLVTSWYNATLQFFEKCAHASGFPDYTDTDLVDTTLEMSWTKDVMEEFDENRLAGEILSVCFSHCKLFEDVLPVILYSSQKDLTDVTKSMVVSVTELHVVRVYHQGKNVYYSAEKGVDSVDYSAPSSGLHPVPRNKGPSTVCFGYIHQDEVIPVFQPNAVEIFEGRISYFKLGRGNPKWFEVLAPWLRIQNISENFHLYHNVDIARSRYLLTSFMGKVDGYYCRVEAFEECFGVIVCVVHGLPGGVQVLRFGNTVYRDLIQYCDVDEEKPALDNVDVHRTAILFADRLKIVPSKNMMDFLTKPTLCMGPRSFDIPQVVLRKRGGPGRRLGSQAVKFEGAEFIISVYEIHNETDAYFLRVLLYDPAASKTVEYRISPIERILLFNGLSTYVFPLIVARFKVSRVLKSEFTQHEDPLIQLDESIIQKAQDLNFKTQSAKAAQAGDDLYNLCSIGDHVEALDRDFDGSNDSSDIEAGRRAVPISDDDVVYVLYFDRSLNTVNTGNIQTSISLCLPREGFVLAVIDKIKRYRIQKFIPYADMYRVLKYTYNDFLEIVDSIDDADTVLELFEEIMEQLETDLDDDFGTRLVLNPWEPGSAEPLFVAFIQHAEDGEFADNDESEVSSSAASLAAEFGLLSEYMLHRGNPLKRGYIAYSSPTVNYTEQDGDAEDSESGLYRRDYEISALSELLTATKRAERLIVQLNNSPEKALTVADALHMNGVREGVGGRRRGLMSTFLRAKDVRGISKPKYISKYVMQKSYVYFQRSAEKLGDMSRLCWRGRLTPQDFASNTDGAAPSTSYSKRSSKLTRLTSLHDTRVVDEIIEIPDEEGSTEDTANLLPVVVKEVLSEGPGVVNRKYSIEIFSSNRISMGAIEIANAEDMRRVVGAKNSALLEGPEALRDYHMIFNIIVKERLHLSMMVPPSHSQKSGRRVGLSKKIAAKGAIGEGVVVGTAGSIISLQRDDAIVTETAQKGVEADSDSDLDEEYRERDNPHKRRVWLRLFSRRHKMSGRHFRTLVLFEGEDPLMFTRSDIFFQNDTWQNVLSTLTVAFKSEDTLTKEVFELNVKGCEIIPWLPVNLKVDLCHKFRRGKFGQYMLENLRLRYSIVGTFYLALFNMY